MEGEPFSLRQGLGLGKMAFCQARSRKPRLKRIVKWRKGMKHGSFVVLCITLLASVAGNSCAQAFPAKPLRILTSPPGGASDRVARLVADSIAGGLGQKNESDRSQFGRVNH